MLILQSTVFGAAEDGHDFHYEAGQDNDWSDRNACSAVHLVLVEHIGVCTASTCHQQKANRHDAQPDQHPHQVAPVEKRTDACSRFCCGACSFGCGCGRSLCLFHEFVLKVGQSKKNFVVRVHV